MDDLAAWGVMLERLRTADPGFRVFGSAHHRYQVGAPLSEGELTAFESANRVRLPEDYRRFLSVVGNGGAGPFYGIEPLGTFGRDLSRPFPFVAATDTLTDEERERLPERDDSPGVLEFCHQGCGINSYLVVNGPAYRTIWDGREDFFPTGLAFGVWYQRWLKRALLALHNERLVSRLRVGMTRSQVLAEVGGEWQVRPALGRTVRYFEAADIRPNWNSTSETWSSRSARGRSSPRGRIEARWSGQPFSCPPHSKENTPPDGSLGTADIVSVTDHTS